MKKYKIIKIQNKITDANMLLYAIPTNAKAQKQYAKVGTAHTAVTLSRHFDEIPALKSKARAVFFGFWELIKLSGVNIGKYHFGLVLSMG